MRRREQGSVTFSPCHHYRYSLTRDWAPGPRMAAVLLNPSTADADTPDATLTRLVNRAMVAGFGGLTLVNLFALRSPDPRALRNAPDPVGPDNGAAIRDGVAGAAMVLCGWGNHGSLAGRGAIVAAALRGLGLPLWHLGLTQGGAPRHPLYVAAALAARPWTEGSSR